MSYAFTRDVPAGEGHYAEVRTEIPAATGGATPEGMRFYVTGEGAPTADRPARMHDAGPRAWIEHLDRLDLSPTR